MSGAGPVGAALEVVVAELSRAAVWWDDHATDLVRRVRDEADTADAARARHGGAPSWTRLAGSSLPSVPLPVPAWLDETDHEWQRRRAQLVTAGHGAGAALQETAGAYRGADAFIAAAMATDDAVPSMHAPAHWPPVPVGDDNSVSAVGPGIPNRSSPSEIDAAVALWRVRADSAADVCGELDQPVTATWIGTAGAAYLDWLSAHRDRWRALAQDADRIHHALADHVLPDASGGRARPIVAAPALTPSGLAASDAPVVPGLAWLTAPPLVDDSSASEEPGGRHTPSCGHDTDHNGDDGRNHSADNTVTEDGAEGSGAGPSSSESAAPPSDRTGLLWRCLPTYLPGDNQSPPDEGSADGSDRGPADPTSAAYLAPADPPQIPGSSTDDHNDSANHHDSANHGGHDSSGHDGAHVSAADVSGAEIGAETPRSADAGASPPVVVIDDRSDGATDAAIAAGAASSAAAAAAIAAMAQQDRVVHVIGSLGPPPPTPATPTAATPAAAMPAAPTPPVLGPLQPTIPPACTPPATSAPPPSPSPGPPAAHGAPMPDRGALPWSRSALDGLSSAAQSAPPDQPAPDTRRPASDVPRPERRRPGPADPGQRRGSVNDVPTEPIPVVTGARPRTGRILVPLGPDSGRGGLVDLAGTGGLGLHGPGAADIARTILVRLLAHPEGAPPEITMPATVMHRLLDNTDPPDPADLVLTDGPFRALARLDDELARRRHHPDRRPFVVVLPAPRDPRTIRQLQTHLADAPAHTAAVVLLGAWPWGTTLQIAEDHTVIRQTDPERAPATGTTRSSAGHNPGDLTGHHLSPTTAAALRARLHVRTSAASWTTATGTTATGTTATEPTSGRTIDPPDHQADHPTPVPASDTAPATPPDSDQHATTATETTRPPEQPAEAEIAGPPPPTEADPGLVDEPPVNAPDAPDASHGGPAVASESAPPPLVLRVLGEITLHLRTDPNDPDVQQELPLTGRAAAVLAYLAARPARGATRTQLVATLWPDSKATRTESALHTTLTQLRKIARDGPEGVLPIDLRAKHYRITDAVEVDYWNFLPAAKAVMDAPSAPDPTTAELVIGLYRGPYATGYHGDWLDKLRPRVTRLYLTAVWRRVHQLADTDPDRAISLLEKARNHEEDNNFIYYNIMRLHYQAGRYDDAAVAYDHLCTVLDDLAAKPDAPTRALAVQIQRARAAPA